MTMAAGIKYADGIMFCADSQITHGDMFKSFGAKIAYNASNKEYALVTTGAGHMGFMEWYFEKVDGMLAISDKTAATAKQLSEAALGELYRQHISPFAKRHGTGNGEVAMLIGYVGIEKTVNFWRTESTAVVEAAEVECVGSGFAAGTFFAQKTYRDGMDYKEALAVATNLLLQARGFDPYVGGPSSAMMLQRDGKVRRPEEQSIAQLEAFLQGCEKSTWDAILRCADSKLSDEDSESILTKMCERIRVLRRKLGLQSGAA